MSKEWPKVRLGEVLRRSSESITPEIDREYQEVTVRLWGKGVVPRGSILGARLSGQRRFVARTGDFVISRIDARNGASGLVPQSLDGALVTNDFPLFKLAPSRLDAGYLAWFCKTPDFVALCKRASEGTTNRVRLKEERFLDLEVSLPALSGQQRIVARIEAIALATTRASRIRSDSVEETDSLIGAKEAEIWGPGFHGPRLELSAVTTFLSRGRQSEQGDSDHVLIKSQHVQMRHYRASVLTLAPHAAMKVPSEALARHGDVLIACSAAGCLGRVAKFESSGIRASTDTHVAIARADSAMIDPDYLYRFLASAPGQRQLRSRERGDWEREKIGFRLTELNLRDLRQVEVPVPSIAEQRRILRYLAALESKTAELKDLQSQVAAKIAALMPAVLDRAFRGEL